jgi:hypothetical protein
MTPNATILLLLISLQTLSEAARREAERRKALDEQGIRAKVVDASTPAQDPAAGNLSISTGLPRNTPPVSKRSDSAAKASPGVRASIRKLDREIKLTEDRLRTLRRQAEAERWAPPRAGKVTRRGTAVQNEERIREEISELETKLNRLREERFQIYDDARKSGLLPGEIDGKGIIP